ncbi:MAG: ATP phosphoribosyltransferase [Tissierellia bacterium]|nr:ATP phosphoribosyltransferase [Tissierellia bacterium]
MLNVALTKGRLEEDTMELLKNRGYGIEEWESKGRQLILQDRKKNVRYFLVKSADCLTYVEHGVADVGVVGSDVMEEYGGDYYDMLDMDIGICKFVVAMPKGKEANYESGHLKIGTKYPNVATKFFKGKGFDVEIVKIEGSVELGPILGLCDAIVDITETGTTLKENGLTIVDEVFDINAKLIVNKASFRIKREQVMAFIDDLKGE